MLCRIFICALVLAAAIGGALPASAAHVPSTSPSGVGSMRLVMPLMNPIRGKALFVDKGCIACHAINGVGGHDAPPMDAHVMGGLMNPFDFAAKMWNHAEAMIALQVEALGEQAYFTGQELADIIAFVHDDETQHGFSEADLTDAARKLMQHGHGTQSAPAAHSEEIGHPHAPGAKPHKD